MPRSRKDIRSLLAIFGVVVLLATTVITLGTARPTEATWQDTVIGESQFGTHENAGSNYARAIATYGTMTRSVSGDESRGPVESAVTSAMTSPRAETPARTIRSPFGTAVLPVNTEARTCARADRNLECAPEPTAPTPKPANYAVAELHELEVFSLRVLGIPTIPLVTYDADEPIRATASCTPGAAGQAAVSTGGSIVLGDRALSNRVSVPVPTAPGVSGPVPREWGAYNYQASVVHDRVEQTHHAVSQVRLVVEATAWDSEGERWALNIILARAECGVAMRMPPEPQRPSTLGLGRMAAAPATVQTPDEEAVDGSTTKDPTKDDAADEEEAATRDEATASNDATTAPTSSVSPTTEPTSPPRTTASATPPSPTSRQDESSSDSDLGTTTTVATEPKRTESPKPTTSTEAPAGPQKLQDVRVGREFAVITREGVELGAARIEDIERMPGCGVEITLDITTSAEDGPDRWASIDHRDFAEVRPGGSTRPAQRTGSECASGAAAGPAQLRVGGVHEVVVVIQISDTADRAIFRPEGTAGWVFDLPSLPRMAATPTTSPQAVAPTSVPSSSPSATTTAAMEEASVATAEA